LPGEATSLLVATGRVHDRDRLLDALLDRFEAAYASFVAAGGRPDLAGWRARAALLGEAVAVEADGERRVGIFADVAEDGALLLALSDGTVERIVAGDLVRGPVAAGRA
jgi:BirA family biotin operon repressor/biotin-[acetyl-CoA-carboxylase] ligase